MTDFYINDNKIELRAKKGQRLADIMEEVLNNFITKEQVIMSIDINDGQFVDELFNSEQMNKDVNDLKKVKFTTQSTLDLAKDSLLSCNMYIDHITERIRITVDSFKSNKMDEANHFFAEVIETVDLFIELIAKIQQTLESEWPNRNLSNSSQKELEIDLLNIFKSLIPARENNDIIMLCDLLEYELLDNLKQWKQRVIPEIKNRYLDIKSTST